MEILFVILIFLVAFIPRFLAAIRIDMTWDEGLYALSGITSVKNVVTHNFNPDAWGSEFHQPILMYLFGIVYSVYVLIKTIFKHGFRFNFNLFSQEGYSLFKGRQTLMVLRLPSVILGSLSCVVTYLLCLDLFKSNMVGIVAALFLALAPIFIAWSSLAMLESGVTFFYLLTVWTLLRGIEGSSLVYIVFSGIALGLAFGSKETGFGVPLVVLPWATFLMVNTYVTDGVNVLIGQIGLLFLWVLIGLIVFYVTWPWLWKNPIKQFMRNLRATSKMASRQGAGIGFYPVNLLASTPVVLMFLYGVGTIASIFLAITQTNIILILSWAFLPLIIMSLPFVPKRGGTYEITFILPPLSILAGLATFGLSKVLADMLQIFFGSAVIFGSISYDVIAFWFLGSSFLCLVVLACLRIHPYYVDYYNFLVKYVSSFKRTLMVGWWGEGMGNAINYVDQYAPPNTTIWIYGPKTTALYHSSRVDFGKSFQNKPLFYERSKAGFEVPTDNAFNEWRKGDLNFYFPYYYSHKPGEYDMARLKTENVSYLLIYKWATYSQLITGIDEGNCKMVSTIREKCVPVFTVKLKNQEVCWVYKVA